MWWEVKLSYSFTAIPYGEDSVRPREPKRESERARERERVTKHELESM